MFGVNNKLSHTILSQDIHSCVHLKKWKTPDLHATSVNNANSRRKKHSHGQLALPSTELHKVDVAQEERQRRL